MNSSSLSVVEEFPIIEKVMSHVKKEIKGVGDQIKKTANDWYEKLDITTSDKLNDERLPKNVSALGKQIKTLAPTFRTLGYDVKNETYNKRDDTFPRGSKIITFTKLDLSKISGYQ